LVGAILAWSYHCWHYIEYSRHINIINTPAIGFHYAIGHYTLPLALIATLILVTPLVIGHVTLAALLAGYTGRITALLPLLLWHYHMALAWFAITNTNNTVNTIRHYH